MQSLVYQHKTKPTCAVQFTSLCINMWMSCQRNLPAVEKELFPTTASLAKMLEPQAPPTKTSGTVSEDALPAGPRGK